MPAFIGDRTSTHPRPHRSTRIRRACSESPCCAADSAPACSATVTFTADDFGLCREVNRAVLRAHRDGVLTDASLMISAPAAEEAIQIARSTPSLSVGLHLVLTDARPVLPPSRLPHLVDHLGRLPRDPLRAGLLFAASTAARAELVAELRSQFERFAATGLPLAHVDGHMHMHVHPAVVRHAVALAAEFGARGFRLPREPLGPILRSNRSALELSSVARTASLSLLSRRAQMLSGRAGLATTSQCYGIFRTGRMDGGDVAGFLERLNAVSAELIFHPTDGPRLDTLGPNPGDLDALLSARVRSVIRRRRMRLASYSSSRAGRGAQE